MIFESSKMILKVVRIVQTAEANDIYVCQDLATEAESLYTVLFIKRHDIVHGLLKVFEKTDKSIEDVCVECFSVDDNFIAVFPYVQERPLEKFYIGRTYTLSECEGICINLVINLMTSNIPFPIIYLALSQGQLNIAKDQTVYMGYQLDLTNLDEAVGEKKCVEECAKIVLKMLESKQSETSVMSYNLIDKKIYRHSYNYFTELYKDIRITAVPDKQKGIIARLKAKFRRNKDKIFKVLLVVALILGFFVLASFLTNIIFGDIPWLRLLIGGFKYIGTENLAQ